MPVVRAGALWDAPRQGMWEQLRHRTLRAAQGRAGPSCSRGSGDVASPVPRCLYRCVPDLELGAQRADSERQMELVLRGVVPAWLFWVGSSGAGGCWLGSTHEQPGWICRTPAPGQGLAVLPMPHPPSPGLQRFCWAFTRAFTLTVAESVSCPMGCRVIPAASPASQRAGSARERAWTCLSSRHCAYKEPRLTPFPATPGCAV